MKKIILLEINEVPHRIYDDYCKNHPNTVLSNVISQSRRYTTISTDGGELHPWSTWPTLHRGVDNSLHEIKDIGEDLQEPNSKFPPIWDLLRQSDIPVGIFSSLHTYPLDKNVEEYEFMVPDPFAIGEETHPVKFIPFQDFNLAMTRRSGRSVNRGIDWKKALKLISVFPRIGVRIKTLGRIVFHLLDEFFNSWKSVRRRTFQSVIAFDLFYKILKQKKPAFATFFSNHVASAMHRYWAASFPNDYENNMMPQEWIERYRNEIPYCMNQLNQMISDVLKFISKNSEYKLIIASSMGQSATKAIIIKTELTITDSTKFVQKFNEFGLTSLSAMHPQYNFEVKNSDDFEKLLKTITINEKPLSFRRKGDNFFSIDFGHPNQDRFIMNVDGVEVPIEEFGLANQKVDDQSGGTAYHIPEGTFFIYDPLVSSSDIKNKEIDLREVAPAILNYYGLKRKEYMLEPSFSI